jgi:hypothetical protein
MTIINEFTKAIKNGVPATSVRLRQIEDQEWAVTLTKEGQVALTLGKEVQKAKMWPSHMTQRLRGWKKKDGKLGPNSTANMNSADIYVQGLGWIPMKGMPLNISDYQTLLGGTSAPKKLTKAFLRKLTGASESFRRTMVALCSE